MSGEAGGGSATEDTSYSLATRIAYLRGQLRQAAVEFFPVALALGLAVAVAAWIWTKAPHLIAPPGDGAALSFWDRWVSFAPLFILAPSLLLALGSLFFRGKPTTANAPLLRGAFCQESWRAVAVALFLTCLTYGLWFMLVDYGHQYFPRLTHAVGTLVGEGDKFTQAGKKWRIADPIPATTQQGKPTPVTLVLTTAAMSSGMTLLFGLLMVAAVLLFAWTPEARRKALKEISSDVYYLGFILTLIGLAISLNSYRQGGGAAGLTEAIAKCGASIGSTAVAILLRVVLRRAADEYAEQDAKTGGAKPGGNGGNGGNGGGGGGNDDGGGGGRWRGLVGRLFCRLILEAIRWLRAKGSALAQTPRAAAEPGPRMSQGAGVPVSVVVMAEPHLFQDAYSIRISVAPDGVRARPDSVSGLPEASIKNYFHM